MLAPLDARSAQALLSPSARIVAAASAPDGGASRVATLPWADVHWTTLLELAAFERAEAQVHRLLSIAPAGTVPAEVLRSLQGLARVAAFRAVELAEAAAAAQDALAGAGVAALWLKGAALAMQSPAQFAVRGMGDLDLLIAPADHERARQALRAAGWAGPIQSQGFEAHHHDAPMTWGSGTQLELHRGLFTPGHPFTDASVEAWIGRGVAHHWGNRVVTVLPPAWHVVHASVHWTWGHEGEIGTWQYLHDMHQLATTEGGPAFWGAVTAAARALGASAPVGWGLWSAAMLAGVPVEPDTWRGLRGGPGLAGMVEREWVLRAFQSPAASPSVRWTRFWWRRAMGELGAAGGRFPWALGRAAVTAGAGAPVAGVGRTPELVSRGGSGTGRWVPHLLRVLRS